MTTVCCIQARMGSTRFPGKSLADLNGVPMLVFMLRRLAPLERNGIVDHLVVATTDQPEDDAIANACHDRGVTCARGDELDVLSRFRDVAEHFNADTVIRLTGDSPLVWGALVAEVLTQHHSREAAGGSLAYFTYLDAPDGFDVEVMSRQALEDATDTEHVTKSLYPLARRIPFVKLSVDTPDDLQRVREFLNAG